MLYSEIVYRDEMVSSLSDGGAGGWTAPGQAKSKKWVPPSLYFGI